MPNNRLLLLPERVTPLLPPLIDTSLLMVTWPVVRETWVIELSNRIVSLEPSESLLVLRKQPLDWSLPVLMISIACRNVQPAVLSLALLTVIVAAELGLKAKACITARATVVFWSDTKLRIC